MTGLIYVGVVLAALLAFVLVLRSSDVSRHDDAEPADPWDTDEGIPW